jgi:hypothetical protein
LDWATQKANLEPMRRAVRAVITKQNVDESTWETVDEFYKYQLRRLIHILQDLPWGSYKRIFPDSEVQEGKVISLGDYQALMLTLEYLSNPDQKRGRD